MKEKTEKDTSLKEKFNEVVEEIEQKRNEKLINQNINPYIKVGLYVSGVFVLVWASQFAFAAFAGAIKQFKNLRRAIREK